MKNLFAITFVSALLTSCVDFSGTLNVTDDLVLKGKDGQAVRVSAARHRADIDYKKKLFSKKAKVQLKIDGKDTVEFKLKKGQKIPKYAGTVELSSEVSGQPYDAVAILDTFTRSSRPTITDESCSISMTYKQCDMSSGDPVYITKTKVLRGRKKVEFHYDTTTKGVEIELLDKESGAQVATFVAGKSSSNKVYTFKGQCRPLRGEMVDFRRLKERAVICRVPRQ